MNIQYSKQAEKFIKLQPAETAERLREASKDAWGNIQVEKPDEWDIRMLEEAKSDPECSIFTKEDEIDWNTPGDEAKKVTA